MVRGGCVGISYADDFPMKFKKPKIFIERIKKAIKEIV